MQIGSLPPRPSPREAGDGRGGEDGGGDAGRGGGGEALGRGARPAPAPPAGQGEAGRVCSPPRCLLRAGVPRLPVVLMLMLPWMLMLMLPLALMLPAACVRSSLAGILGAPRPARSLGRPAAPPLPPPQILTSPSGARESSRWMLGADKPHSDTGGQPSSPSPSPARRDARWLHGEPRRCTCSSAGPQPTLDQRSPGETNPSAARRASDPARLAPAARGSAPLLPPPPVSQTPASYAAARSGVPRGAPQPARRGSQTPPALLPGRPGLAKKWETATGVPDVVTAAPSGFSHSVRRLRVYVCVCVRSRRGRGGIRTE